MDCRLLVLTLGMFALGTDGFVIAGVLPRDLARASMSPSRAAGQMTTIYAITYALLAPTIAALAAGVRRKSLLFWSLALFVVANIGTALTPTYGIAMARVVAGISAAMFAPTATRCCRAACSAGTARAALSGRGGGRPERLDRLGHAHRRRHRQSRRLALDYGLRRGACGRCLCRRAGDAAGDADAAENQPRATAEESPWPMRGSGFTLLTTLLTMSGIFTVYTYFAVVFDRAIAGDGLVLGALLVLWGVAGALANFLSGRLIDAIGDRKVIFLLLAIQVVVTASLPWAGAHLWSAGLAIAIWGGSAWGYLVPQQHRLSRGAAGCARGAGSQQFSLLSRRRHRRRGRHLRHPLHRPAPSRLHRRSPGVRGFHICGAGDLAYQCRELNQRRNE